MWRYSPEMRFLVSIPTSTSIEVLPAKFRLVLKIMILPTYMGLCAYIQYPKDLAIEK
jgi:hypothetical protein